MAAPTNHWKLGLFVVFGAILTLGTIGVLGAGALHAEVGHYVSYFDESVQGLEVGSPIKFRGVTIGKVGRIEIAPDHRLVEVESDLGVAELSRLGLDIATGPLYLGAPKRLTVATDLRVQLVAAGLTGIKFLQLDFFTVADNAPPVLPFPAPENYIPAAPSTMKNIEDSLVRAIHRLPEVTDQLSSVLTKVDGLLGDFDDKQLPGQLVATLNHANQVLGEAQHKIEQVDTQKLASEANRALRGMTETVTRMNGLLARVDGENGLLSSAVRSSDAFGDTLRGVDGVGTQLEDALTAVKAAARSVHKLADAVETEPDMLVKGRARSAVRDR